MLADTVGGIVLERGDGVAAGSLLLSAGKNNAPPYLATIYGRTASLPCLCLSARVKRTCVRTKGLVNHVSGEDSIGFLDSKDHGYTFNQSQLSSNVGSPLLTSAKSLMGALIDRKRVRLFSLFRWVFFSPFLLLTLFVEFLSLSVYLCGYKM